MQNVSGATLFLSSAQCCTVPSTAFHCASRVRFETDIAYHVVASDEEINTVNGTVNRLDLSQLDQC